MVTQTIHRWSSPRTVFRSVLERLIMGGIVGGGPNAKQQKAIGSLQFQTSQHGGVIPLVYGTTAFLPI